MNPQTLQKLIGTGIILFALVLIGSQMTYIVEPGNRGVRVTLGKVSPDFVPEGLAWKMPIITQIHQVSLKQQTQSLEAKCYTSDLQQVITELRVLYRIPETSVVALWTNYEGDAREQTSYFFNLIRPRVVEALKEAEATVSAEEIVQKREIIKEKTLAEARLKIGQNAQGTDALIAIVDITLQDLRLSEELTLAIEQKMTQEQEAEKAKFIQEKVEIEAQTAIIKAEGEANSIRIRGEALRQNPLFIDLKIVEKWDGISPIVVGSDSEDGAAIMIPVDPFNK